MMMMMMRIVYILNIKRKFKINLCRYKHVLHLKYIELILKNGEREIISLFCILCFIVDSSVHLMNSANNKF